MPDDMLSPEAASNAFLNDADIEMIQIDKDLSVKNLLKVETVSREIQTDEFKVEEKAETMIECHKCMEREMKADKELE